MRALTTDLEDVDRRPYFLWDEDTSIAELRGLLAGPPGALRDRALAKMLREARDIDVWRFVGLASALQKDGGCTPATLAWLLSEIEVPDGVRLPGDITPAELRSFIADLVVRLRRAAHPTPVPGA